MENNYIDYTQLPRKEKYIYLVSVLEKIETNKFYKGEEIDSNYELETQREKDIEYMNDVISDELKKDNISKMFVKERFIRSNKNS